MRLNRYPDPSAAAEACARHILALLGGKIDAAPAGGHPASLAISGGSSPRLMFEVFAKTPFPWDRVHVFWVDERAVPHTDQQSNFKLADDAWLTPAKFPGANVHAVDTRLPPAEAARRYSDELRAWFQCAPGEMPHFDVTHLGIGPDCHTASLFPGEPLIDDRAGLAASVWAERFQQWRITLLPGVLLAARQTILLISGADKAEALRSALEGPQDPRRFPAQLVARGRDSTLFVDEAAGSLLR